MQFLSLSRRRTDAFPPEAFTPDRIAQEGARVKELYASGILRQIWARADTPGAAILWGAPRRSRCPRRLRLAASVQTRHAGDRRHCPAQTVCRLRPPEVAPQSLIRNPRPLRLPFVQSSPKPLHWRVVRIPERGAAMAYPRTTATPASMSGF